MKKAQLPLIAELSLRGTEEFTGKSARKFIGTTNPRQLRVLAALERNSLPREQLDRVAGSSNGPEVIACLRRRGLELPCYRVPCIDRDGRIVRPGVYALTPTDKRKIQKWASCQEVQ